MRCIRYFIIILFVVCLAACSEGRPIYAPVTELANIEPIPKNGIHRVTAGESIYSIAWRYGLDYRYLARRNQLLLSHHLQPGEKIYLRGLVKELSSVLAQPPIIAVANWQWPAQGFLIAGYSSSNRGINIAGRVGDPIFAAAAGKVVYSGNGLRAYGNLIIVKHNNQILTAYAYNHFVLVKEGDSVKTHQKIAEMGRAGGRAMLHFEIRRDGQPVNPLAFLGKKN